MIYSTFEEWRTAAISITTGAKGILTDHVDILAAEIFKLSETLMPYESRYGQQVTEAKEKLRNELTKFVKDFERRTDALKEDLYQDNKLGHFIQLHANNKLADISKTLRFLGDEKSSTGNYELIRWGFQAGISDKLLNTDWHRLRVLTGGVLGELSEQLIADRGRVESDPVTAIQMAVESVKRMLDKAPLSKFGEQITPSPAS